VTSIDIGVVGHHVHNLLGTYAEKADDRDADAVAELFGRARVDFAGTTLRRRDEISAHYTALFAGAPPSRHLLTNIIIDVTDADHQVAARCRYSRWAIDPDATLLAIGDYRATFARSSDDHWHFSSFIVSRAWAATTPPTQATNPEGTVR